jgi:hypothetical protein
MLTITFCIAPLGSALAGEKYRGRHIFYTTKWEPVEVGDKEGHIIAIVERKGIHTDFDRKPFSDGWAIHNVGIIDMNTKTGTGYSYGYDVLTDKDGDKVFHKWEGKPGKNGQWGGTVTFLGGTGKWKGINGTGSWIWYDVPPLQGYGDNEWVVELP